MSSRFGATCAAYLFFYICPRAGDKRRAAEIKAILGAKKNGMGIGER